MKGDYPMKKQHVWPLAVAFILVLASCKKDAPANNNNSGGGSTDSTLANSPANLVKDSALLYARDIYLWYDQIPSSFKPRTYADPDAIMRAIRPYSIEPGFTNPVDRWSFAALKKDWDNTSAGIQQDFGMYVFFLQEGDLRVRFVEKNSPADKAGIRRGWRITRINSLTNINTSAANSIVNAVYFSNTGSFGFQKPDGATADVTLNAATYNSDPILLDSVYTAGTKKVGYLVFNSFLGDTTSIYNSFTRIFNKFASNGVNDVVVDLRYNGGGYVSVQQRLANWLAPTAANGKVQMSQTFNNRYSSYNSTYRFQKLGSLNLDRIFFIVSSNTASASELLINNMRPYMSVRVVGPSASYGKPVGYFPIPVGDWYVFPVSLRTTNANNEGNYFNGFVPEKVTADGIDKDWGDRAEASFASVLNFISTGTFGYIRPSINLSSAENAAIGRTNAVLEGNTFKGAVVNPKKR
jgi:hypothetical protein